MGLTESRTLAAILEKGELPSGAVVLLDEAGQVGTRDFARLVNMLDSVNGRLILCGDPYQHGSVGAGDMLRLLSRHSGCDAARIKTIRRQKDEFYKAAVTKLSQHKSIEAWDMLDSAGKVEELPSDERREALAKWVANGLNNNKHVLTVAPTWNEIDRVTESIRAELVQRGMLGRETKKVTVSQRIDLTKAQRKQSRCYAVGMEIIERRGLGLPVKRMRIKAIRGETLVMAADAPENQVLLDLTKTNPKASWTVHKPAEINVRIGDRLLLQTNDRPAGYHNGDLVSVTGFNDDAILLNDGRTITKDYTQYTFGWAVTSYASQGLTSDQVAISYDQNSFGAIDRRGFYVACSRARETLQIFTDDKAFVRDCLRKHTGERTTASELVASTSPALTQRMCRKRQQQLLAAVVAKQAPDTMTQRTPIMVPAREPVRQLGH